VKVSDFALPPVTQAEAERAEHSVCPYHRKSPRNWWREGQAYFCPVGRQLWRYTEKRVGMYAPLPYSHTGIV